MTIARRALAVIAMTTLAWAAGCAGHDGAASDGPASERDGIITKGKKSSVPCGELPAGSKLKCGPGDDGSSDTGSGGGDVAPTPTVHLIGDLTTAPVPFACHSIAGAGGTWLPTSAAQAPGPPLSNMFCELVWMASGGSQPDYNALSASFPGVVFSPDPTCTDTVCGNPTEAVIALKNGSGGNGGATCNACVNGALVGQIVNGTLYISLPPAWVQSSDTVQYVFRPFDGFDTLATRYTVSFPANTRWLRVTTSNRTSALVNGPLYMNPPNGIGQGQ